MLATLAQLVHAHDHNIYHVFLELKLSIYSVHCIKTLPFLREALFTVLDEYSMLYINTPLTYVASLKVAVTNVKWFMWIFHR